jgi:hypothetical protein
MRSRLKVGEYVGFTFTKLANIEGAYICALAMICLDHVLVESLDLDTFKMQVSTTKNSRRLISLYQDPEILILSQHHLPVPKVSIEIEKSVKT